LWNEAFGIPILHISSIVAGAKFKFSQGGVFPPPPDSLGLWTSICLGSEENCANRNDGKTPDTDYITASSLVNMNPGDVNDNTVMVLLSTITVEHVLNVAAAVGGDTGVYVELIKDTLPDGILGIGVHPFETDPTQCDSI
jgi:hypothetical protein